MVSDFGNYSSKIRTTFGKEWLPGLFSWGKRPGRVIVQPFSPFQRLGRIWLELYFRLLLVPVWHVTGQLKRLSFCMDTGCNGELCMLFRRGGRWIVHVTHNTLCVLQITT